MFGIFDMLKKWFFKEYEQDKLDIDRAVAARFARGNIRVQNGRYVNEKELKDLSVAADKALKKLAGNAQQAH